MERDQRIQIISSGQYRPLINKANIPKNINHHHQYDDGYFLYLGKIYNVNLFGKIKFSSEAFFNWDGILKEKEYTGVLIKYSSDRKSVKVANYILPFIRK